MTVRPALLASLALLAGLPAAARAEEPATRTFPAQRVKYTLPGPGWEWFEDEPGGSVFTARDERGYGVGLTTDGPIGPQPFDAQFVAEFEAAMYDGGCLRKRSWRAVTVHGLPAYQAEGVSDDGRTVACRAFYANGLMYTLLVFGGPQPIEDDPDFDAILRGFEFTEPPAVYEPAGPEEARSPVGHLMRSGAFPIFVAVALAALNARSRRKAQARASGRCG